MLMRMLSCLNCLFQTHLSGTCFDTAERTCMYLLLSRCISNPLTPFTFSMALFSLTYSYFVSICLFLSFHFSVTASCMLQSFLSSVYVPKGTVSRDVYRLSGKQTKYIKDMSYSFHNIHFICCDC